MNHLKQKTMKTNAIFSLIVALGVIFTSCSKEEQFVTPSGRITTTVKSVSGFSKLEVSDPFMVYLTFSDESEQVRVEANENLQSYIIIESRNDVLSIELEDNINIRKGEAVLNVYITAKQVSDFSASGAASIILQNQLTGQSADIQLTGASHMSGSIQVNDLRSILSGASSLDLEGSANNYKIEATGACEMDDFYFTTQYLDADLEGASNVSITVTEMLDVKARGASTVFFKGSGLISHQDLSDTSKIIRVD
jgi:hypothetical protein